MYSPVTKSSHRFFGLRPIDLGFPAFLHFTLTYFDARSCALKLCETFTDEYKQVDDVWFPASWRVVQAENGKVITRVIEFQNPRIRFGGEQAAR